MAFQWLALKRTSAGGIQAVAAECLGQFDHTKATSICLFWMASLAHDHIDKHFDIWSDADGLSYAGIWVMA